MLTITELGSFFSLVSGQEGSGISMKVTTPSGEFALIPITEEQRSIIVGLYKRCVDAEDTYVQHPMTPESSIDDSGGLLQVRGGGVQDRPSMGPVAAPRTVADTTDIDAQIDNHIMELATKAGEDISSLSKKEYESLRTIVHAQLVGGDDTDTTSAAIGVNSYSPVDDASMESV